MATRMPAGRDRQRGVRIRVAAVWRGAGSASRPPSLAVPVAALCFAAGYYYVSFARMIDAAAARRARARAAARLRPAARAAARPVAHRAAARRSPERPRLHRARRAPRSPASSSVGDGVVTIQCARRRRQDGRLSPRRRFSGHSRHAPRVDANRAAPSSRPIASSGSRSATSDANGSSSMRRCSRRSSPASARNGGPSR